MTVASAVTDDGIGVITLARPERHNALSVAVREELIELLGRWAGDPAVRVAVLTGSGRSFCAGFDLDEFADAALAPAIADSSRRYHVAVWSFPKPLIAAVNGAALAGGFDLAVLCDLRIAAEGATFAHPEVKFGAPPLFTPLRWIVGDGVARDLVLTGRRIDAEEALRIGLVSRVVAADALLDEAYAAARQIAEAPQPALEMLKAYLVSSQGKGFDDAFLVEHDEVFAKLLTGSVGPRAEA